jgi:hypothetical protein
MRDCNDCAESDENGEPSNSACAQCLNERDNDYGGALGADGKVYSDCDPGL